MSLAPEAIAFIGRPPAALPVATRAHRLDDTHMEGQMPTGVYSRKKKAAKAVEKPEAKVPKVKVVKVGIVRAPKALATGPRFGVFEDGTVELRLASCKGTLGPKDACDLNAFITRLQAK